MRKFFRRIFRLLLLAILVVLAGMQLGKAFLGGDGGTPAGEPQLVSEQAPSDPAAKMPALADSRRVCHLTATGLPRNRSILGATCFLIPCCLWTAPCPAPAAMIPTAVLPTAAAAAWVSAASPCGDPRQVCGMWHS